MFFLRTVMSMKIFLKLMEVVEQLNSLYSDENDVEIAVLMSNASEATEENE